jgi:hypothetical protein
LINKHFYATNANIAPQEDGKDLTKYLKSAPQLSQYLNLKSTTKQQIEKIKTDLNSIAEIVDVSQSIPGWFLLLCDCFCSFNAVFFVN